MSPAAAARPRTRRRSKRKQPGLVFWWPLALALIAAPFAVRAASVLALTGPGALRALFPFVALWQAHAPGTFAPEQREALAAWMLWAQFPVYGLVLSLFARKRKLGLGFAAVVLLHGAALAAALVTR